MLAYFFFWYFVFLLSSFIYICCIVNFGSFWWKKPEGLTKQHCHLLFVLLKDNILYALLYLLVSLTLIKMGLFRAVQGLWGAKVPPYPTTCHTYPKMMKLFTVIYYLKRIQNHINQVIHFLSFTDISNFSREISNFCYIKKYRWRLCFNF